MWALDAEQEGGAGDSGAGGGAMEVDSESEGVERGGPGEDVVVAVYMGSVARQGNGEKLNGFFITSISMPQWR